MSWNPGRRGWPARAGLMYYDDDNDIDYYYDYDYYILRLMTLITMLMVTRMSWKPWEDGMGGRIDRTNGSEVTQRLGNTCPHIPRHL